MREGKSIFGGGGRIANQWHRSLVRNDRVFARGAVQVRRRGEGTPPYGTVCRGGRLCPPGLDNATPCRAGPVCPAVGAGKTCRADVGIGPYGSATRGAMGGRPQGSPLRKRNKRCNGQATARVAPTKALQGTQEKNPPVTASPCQPPLGKGAKDGGTDCHSSESVTGSQ